MKHITLCEECFPGAGNYETYTVVPLTPCDQCGRSDERRAKGLRCNLFPRDPRIAGSEKTTVVA